MQNTKSLTLVFFLFINVISNSVHAQNFIGKKYFTKDTVFINPEQVGYRLTENSAIYTFDGIDINIESLHHIEEDDTRYKITGINREGTLKYSKRILAGSSIDIYSKDLKAFEVYPLLSYVDKKKILMEIQGGPLQKISYRNLQPYSLNNQHIANELKSANKLRIVNGLLATTAIASFVYIAASNIGERSGNPTASIFIPLGLLIPIGITAAPLKKRYYKVIDIINSQP